MASWRVTWSTTGTTDVDTGDELEAKTIVDALTLEQLIAIGKVEQTRVISVMQNDV